MYYLYVQLFLTACNKVILGKTSEFFAPNVVSKTFIRNSNPSPSRINVYEVVMTSFQ